MKRSLFGLCVAALLGLWNVGAMAAKTVLIDVRTPEEFAQDHIPGALNIEYQNIAQQASRAAWAKDDKLILYCRTGRRSEIAYKSLQNLGYKNVLDYGGIDAARLKLKPQK